MRFRVLDKHVDLVSGRARIPDPAKAVEKLRELAAPATAQIMNPDLIAGPEHVFFAVLNMEFAHAAGKSIAKKLDVELLLWLTARRQIAEAVSVAKPEAGTDVPVALILIHDDPGELSAATERVVKAFGLREDSSLLEVTDRKLPKLIEAFEIDERAIKALEPSLGRREAVAKLVIEKVALLVLRL